MKWIENKLQNKRVVKSLNLRGETFDVSDLVSEKYCGPKSFNLFYVDFNGLFTDLLEDVVEPEKRITSDRDGLVSLSFISDEAKFLLEELVEVVNFSARPIISLDRKRRYGAVLGKLAKILSDYREKNMFIQEDLTIVPLKGGSYFWNFLRDGKSGGHTLAIDCKRIPVSKTNSFGFGMGIDRSAQYLKNNHVLDNLGLGAAKKIRIVELCIVSGMTTLGFLLYLENNGLKPEEVEINTIAISQQGFEFIQSYAKSRGIKVTFVTGGVYYRLGNYYESRRDELLTLDGKLVIGEVRSFLD